MFFHGWLPHLASTLDTILSIQDLEQNMTSKADREYIKNNHKLLDFDIGTDDSTQSMRMMFRIPQNFEYSGPELDAEPMLAYIHNIRRPLEVRMWIEKTGIVHMETPDVIGMDAYNDGGRLDLQRMRVESENTYAEYMYIHHVCKKLFSVMRGIIGLCFPDDSGIEQKDIPMNGPDDTYFTLEPSIGRETSINRLSDMIVKTIQNELMFLQYSYDKLEKKQKTNRIPQPMTEDGVFHKHYCYTMGHITHGWSFLHKFEDSIPGCDWTQYGNALVQYEGSVKTLYEAHVNMDNRQLNSTIKLLTMATVAIGAITAMTGIIL